MRKQNREFIICGDYNTVHKEIDIKNWKSNQKNSGCTPQERAWLDKLFGQVGYVDAFRIVLKEKVVLAVVENQPIRVVHPILLWREMKLRAMALAVQRLGR